MDDLSESLENTSLDGELCEPEVINVPMSMAAVYHILVNAKMDLSNLELLSRE